MSFQLAVAEEVQDLLTQVGNLVDQAVVLQMDTLVDLVELVQLVQPTKEILVETEYMEVTITTEEEEEEQVPQAVMLK